MKKKPTVRGVFLQRQKQIFENVTLVALRRKRCWCFLAICFVADLPQKKRCFNTQEFTRVRFGHSVESRAPTCPFKQNNMSAWSLLS